MCDRFLPLKCTCPAEDCDNKKTISWIFTSCKHQTRINSDAYLKCSECKKSEPHSIIQHRFNCGEHHDNEYRKVNELGLTSALAMMRSCQKDLADKLWMSKLSKAFMAEITKLD